MTNEDNAERRFGKSLATATGGALIGAAIGGPVGAVVGGAVGPISDYVLEARKRQLERANALALRSAQLAGIGLDDFLKRLSSDERLSDLGLRLLEVASKNNNPDRNSVMAMLLAEALTKKRGTEIEAYEVLGEVLTDIRRPHIDVLMYIFTLTKIGGNKAVSPEEILRDLTEYKEVIRTVVRTLELHGIIVDENRLADPPTNEIRWAVSELGEALAIIVKKAREEASQNGE